MSYVFSVTSPRFLAGRQRPEQVPVAEGPVYGFLRQLQGEDKSGMALQEAVIDVLDGNLLCKASSKSARSTKSWLG